MITLADSILDRLVVDPGRADLPAVGQVSARGQREPHDRVAGIAQREEHGEVCPANWSPGKPAMQATPEGVAAYLTENADKL